MTIELDLSVDTAKHDIRITPSDGDDPRDARDQAEDASKAAAAGESTITGEESLEAALDALANGFGEAIAGKVDDGAFDISAHGFGPDVDPADLFAEMGFGMPSFGEEDGLPGGIPGREGLMQESEWRDNPAVEGFLKLGAGVLVIGGGFNTVINAVQKDVPGVMLGAAITAAGVKLYEYADGGGEDAKGEAEKNESDWSDWQGSNDAGTSENDEDDTAVAEGGDEDETDGEDENEDEDTVADNGEDAGGSSGEDASSGTDDDGGTSDEEDEAVAEVAEDEDEATGCEDPEATQRGSGDGTDIVALLGGEDGCGLFGEGEDGFHILIVVAEAAEDLAGRILTDPDNAMVFGEIDEEDLESGVICGPEDGGADFAIAFSTGMVEDALV
jgi:hypothetical protein